MTLHKLSSKEFSQLRDQSSRTFKTKHLLFFYQINKNNDNEDLHVSYGLTVTKKKIKNAVGRNRVKRLLREGLKNSESLDKISNSLKVNIVYAPRSDLSASLCFHDLHKEVEQFFSKFS